MRICLSSAGPGGLGRYMDIFGSRSARAGKVEGAGKGRAAPRVARAHKGVCVPNLRAAPSYFS